MNRTMKKALVAGAALLPLVMAGSAFASTADPELNLIPSDDQFNMSELSLGQIIGGIITLAFILAGVVAFAFLVMGGIKWITSGGDKAKTEEARNMITASLVGLLIVFAAWAIMSLISVFFNIDIFNFTLPTIN